MIENFVFSAIESADNYYNSADQNKHSRIEIRVTNVKRTASNLFLLSLSQKIKHEESVKLCIESFLINPSLYEDPINNYISTSLFSIIRTGEEKATVDIEIKGELLELFSHISPNEIKFVSDLKFLIANVKKWYCSFGHHIHYPPEPLITEKDMVFQGPESDDQKEAVKLALSSNISYIWGAPGTGKTQFVLADCILSYIKKKHQVLVLAPTNNAIEQTLFSVIRALEEQGQSIDCLYRLGSSSESFARQYGSICEKIDHQEKIDLLKRSIEFLTAQKDNENKIENLIACYEQLKTYGIVWKQCCLCEENLSKRIKDITEKSEEISQEMPKYRKILSDIYLRLSEISKRENSLSFKIKRYFTKKEEYDLSIEKNNLSFRVSDAQTHLAKLENEQASIINDLNEAKAERKQTEESKQSAYNDAEAAAQPILHLEKFSIDAALDVLKEEVVKYSDFQPDITLSDKISQKEEELRKLTESAYRSGEGKLVFAFTIDYFFAHYKNLAYVGISSSLISHVFLDEAAYCPLIKAGILFSLNCPVTLLGDHMQLPPICEASSIATADPSTKLFLWDMSAIYFSEIFDERSSLDTLFERYKALKSRSVKDTDNLFSLSEENISIAALPRTFRFGNNLAKILDDFVYKFGFSGSFDFDTQICVIHAKKRAYETELRANIGEAEAIKQFLITNPQKNYAILTPYKAQRSILMDTLREITLPENILTIHASQGREWDTIIVSVTDVRSPFLVNSSLPQGLHTINTAISRAKKNIVIVCDCEYWKLHTQSQLVGKLVEEAITIHAHRGNEVPCELYAE